MSVCVCRSGRRNPNCEAHMGFKKPAPRTRKRPTLRYYPGVECEHGWDCCPICDAVPVEPVEGARYADDLPLVEP